MIWYKGSTFWHESHSPTIVARKDVPIHRSFSSRDESLRERQTRFFLLWHGDEQITLILCRERIPCFICDWRIFLFVQMMRVLGWSVARRQIAVPAVGLELSVMMMLKTLGECAEIKNDFIIRYMQRPHSEPRHCVVSKFSTCWESSIALGHSAFQSSMVVYCDGFMLSTSMILSI